MSKPFDPLTLRGTTVSNRVWVSPMCMYACEDAPGVVGDFHVAHYGQFALGGAGLVLTEATAVLPEGRVTPQDAGLWDDAHIAPWQRVTSLVHAAGSRIGVQLAHAGRKGGKYRGLPGDEHRNRSVPRDAGGWRTLGATGEAFGRYAAPRAADEEDLTAVVAAFGAAARRAVAAGFDVIEVHGAHGYLLHEFLSPATNTRTDAWGADRAGRERLLLECVAVVRTTVPEEVPVFVRLSVDDVVPGGSTAQDSADLSVRLAAAGADLVDCSSGGLVAGVEYAPAPGYQVPLAEQVRARGALPTAAVGLLTTAREVCDVLERGSADAVLLGRQMLRDPHFAARAGAELGVPLRNPRYHRAP
ncbi:oxidoreductase [Kineococcus arenarius]|uniref:oxidoreductase n=1 Tax=unclassified Kineococcus TaxID=2621656 RepID=UPI003D7DC38E